MPRILTVVIVTLVAAGCVKYDERIELNPDGSGVVRMHLVIAEQALPAETKMRRGDTEDDLFPIGREKLTKDLEREGFEVKSLRAESVKGMRHFYVVLHFKNLETLRKSEYFGGRTVTLKRLGAKWRFDQEINVSEKSLTGRAARRPRVEKTKTTPDGKRAKKPPKQESIIRQLERRFGQARVRDMLKNYFISFSVQLKGAGLLRTNGRSHNDDTAIWAIPLSQLIGKRPTIRMAAEFAMTESRPAPKEK